MSDLQVQGNSLWSLLDDLIYTPGDLFKDVISIKGTVATNADRPNNGFPVQTLQTGYTRWLCEPIRITE